MTTYDFVQGQILAVLDESLTPSTATDNIMDHCEQQAESEIETAVDNERWKLEQDMNDSLQSRFSSALRTGTPDLFSPALRSFWIN